MYIPIDASFNAYLKKTSKLASNNHVINKSYKQLRLHMSLFSINQFLLIENFFIHLSCADFYALFNDVYNDMKLLFKVPGK